MKKTERKAFTLIELIAVLVIMAIIALIVTPLVMNIIRKARVSADKRSVDAYGRSIELAIAGYLLDTGKFPTEVSQLTIEYSGNEVVCETTQINSDSSVYLAGCKVAGRSTGDYTYGKEDEVTYDVYSVGDEVTYNNVDYYVIKDSSASEASVTMLKAEPLSVEEVNQYGGVGTANNHVNMYATTNTTSNYYQKAYNNGGYGGMQYYSSATCTNYGDTSGCKSDYASSEVKYVVDAWKVAKAPQASEARLMQYDEFENLGYVEGNITPSDIGWVKTENTPSWVYSNNYWYWTMTPYNDSASNVWDVDYDGRLNDNNVDSNRDVVRPVITISKSAL